MIGSEFFVEKEERMHNTLRNLIFSWMGYFVVILSTFVGRKVFVSTIGSVYLGVNGLFTNILSCLNLVDLGLGVALTYSLYKPLAEHNIEKIKSIVHLLHTVYIRVGIIVAGLGLVLTPFLRFFISGIPSDIAYSELQLYYVLFVLNNAIEYFFYYKSILINADQKQYIVELNYSFSVIGMTVFQIIILYVTKSFLLYLLVQMIFSVIKNIAINYKANKLYPYLKDKKVNKLSKEDKLTLTKGVGGMMFQKIGTVVVNSTDNIIISKFVSIVLVGIYSNYWSIINAVNMVINQIFRSALASVGNFNVTASKKQMYEVFRKSLFVNFWFYGWISIGMFSLFNSFMEIWLGDAYLLDFNVVLILSINFYLNGMRQTCLMYNDALGLYWENRFRPIAEALINLVASLILVQYMGILGVFLGTLISIVGVCMWYEPYIIFKVTLKQSLKDYFKKYILYAGVVLVSGIVTYRICAIIVQTGIVGFFIKVIVCVIIPNIFFFVCFHKTEEFCYFYSFIKKMIFKRS